MRRAKLDSTTGRQVAAGATPRAKPATACHRVQRPAIAPPLVRVFSRPASFSYFLLFLKSSFGGCLEMNRGSLG